MQYQVRFVPDHSLPEGVRWAYARQAGETYLFVKQSTIDLATGRCDAITEAWNAYEASPLRDPSLVAS